MMTHGLFFFSLINPILSPPLGFQLPLGLLQPHGGESAASPSPTKVLLWCCTFAHGGDGAVVGTLSLQWWLNSRLWYVKTAGVVVIVNR